jgi:DNA-binding transcriptional regulator YhcF (GntR family)
MAVVTAYQAWFGRKAPEPLWSGSLLQGSFEQDFWALLDWRSAGSLLRDCRALADLGRCLLKKARTGTMILTPLNRMVTGVTASVVRVMEELVALGRYNEGRIYPSYDYLAQRTGLGRATVARAIRQLRKMKVLERQRRFCIVEEDPHRPGKPIRRQVSNAYRIKMLPPMLKELLPWWHRVGPIPLPDDVVWAMQHRQEEYQRMLDSLSCEEFAKTLEFRNPELGEAVVGFGRAVDRRDAAISEESADNADTVSAVNPATADRKEEADMTGNHQDPLEEESRAWQKAMAARMALGKEELERQARIFQADLQEAYRQMGVNGKYLSAQILNEAYDRVFAIQAERKRLGREDQEKAEATVREETLRQEEIPHPPPDDDYSDEDEYPEEDSFEDEYLPRPALEQIPSEYLAYGQQVQEAEWQTQQNRAEQEQFAADLETVLQQMEAEEGLDRMTMTLEDTRRAMARVDAIEAARVQKQQDLEYETWLFEADLATAYREMGVDKKRATASQSSEAHNRVAVIQAERARLIQEGQEKAEECASERKTAFRKAPVESADKVKPIGTDIKQPVAPTDTIKTGKTQKSLDSELLPWVSQEEREIYAEMQTIYQEMGVKKTRLTVAQFNEAYNRAIAIRAEKQRLLRESHDDTGKADTSEKKEGNSTVPDPDPPTDPG